ncbi:hypothetical protein CCP1ISM_8220001 [Azospirillaceae bacterium]
MADYLTPRVYLEREAPIPAAGTLTGVAAFLGYAAKGQINQPKPLRVAEDFKATFGDSVAGGFLGEAVAGFFPCSGLLVKY